MFIMVTVHAAWIVTNHEKRYEEKEEELSMSRVYNFSAGPAVLAGRSTERSG